MRRALAVLGLAALGAAALLVIAFLLLGRPGADGETASPIPADPIPRVQVRAQLTPRSVLFGDTVTARLDVTLNQDRIDPESVRVVTDFAPWRAIGPPERTRRDGKESTHLRTTFVLRCLASVCMPPDEALPYELEPATVTYDALGAQAPSGLRAVARWPTLVVNTRLDASADVPRPRPGFPARGGSPFASPWRADLISMPPVSYRVDPETARIPLFAGAGVFAVLGLGLAYLGRPRRRPEPEPEPVPVEPEPQVTPLEQALALLEDSSTTDGAADRRRALELVAAELRGRGNDHLADLARGLAWSRQTPAHERTSGLAEEARPALGLDAQEEEEVAEEPEQREEQEKEQDEKPVP
jgi:hypothetical protein